VKQVVFPAEERCKPSPWEFREACSEVVAVIALEVGWWQNNEKFELDDSRAMQHAVRDLAALFCERHASPDDRYWYNRELAGELMDWTMLVDGITYDFQQALKEYPDWLNTQYRMMYGKETIQGLLIMAKGSKQGRRT
jgi:hypothetical protein